jgi:hypothetical protein
VETEVYPEHQRAEVSEYFAMEAGLLERTVPDKPRSRLERYRLTAKGKAFTEKENGEAKLS